jgi:hypothetical protein
MKASGERAKENFKQHSTQRNIVAKVAKHHCNAYNGNQRRGHKQEKAFATFAGACLHELALPQSHQLGPFSNELPRLVELGTAILRHPLWANF